MSEISENKKTPFTLHLTDSKGESFDLKEFELIGSSEDSSIRFTEKDGICPKHTRLEWQSQEGQFLVRDLQSPKGTYINGARIVSAFLQDGDCLSIGNKEMRLVEKKSREERVPLLEESLCPLWQNQIKKLSQIAHSSFPLFITGASGSGKERVAKYAHYHSPRSYEPFITVNCTAFTESLIESELFGHQKGSFTGAIQDRLGAFRAANRGTLFLDEIGDLPLNLQAKLLRVLENKEVKPVGMDRVIPINVRIITATHQDLLQKVCQGKFRLDLFFRLNVLRVHVPALSERMEDFEKLFYFFAKQFRVRFSHDAIERIKKHPWPGNIRELKHLVARASVLFYGKKIDKEMCEELLEKVPENFQTDILSKFISSGSFDKGQKTNNGSLIKEMEKQLIISHLIKTHGNQRQAAQTLGMATSTLNDKIKTYGIDLKKMVEQKYVIGA